MDALFQATNVETIERDGITLTLNVNKDRTVPVDSKVQMASTLEDGTLFRDYFLADRVEGKPFATVDQQFLLAKAILRSRNLANNE